MECFRRSSSRATAVAMLLLAALCGTESRALPVARLREVKPVVEIKAARVWRVARERGALTFGDTLRTGTRGATRVLFNNGTEISLRAQTQIQIVAPPTLNKPLIVRVFGAVGEIFVRAKGPTEIRTAAGTAATRGTEFLVSVQNENFTRVAVSEGRVAFSNARGTVEIAPNQQSSATTTTAPTSPVAVDVSGLIQWVFDASALPLEIENANLKTPADLRAAKQNNAPPLEIALIDAQIALSNGQNQSAQQILTPFEDENAVALPLGLANLRLGDFAGAQTRFESVLAQNPRDAGALTLLANAQLAQSQIQNALQNAQKAVAIAPDSASALATLANAQFFSSDTKNARKNARLALKLDPISPLALLSYGRVEAASGNFDEARQGLAQAASLRGDLRGVQRDLGEVFLALDQLPRAQNAFETALLQNPNDAFARAGLATTFQRTGRQNEAKTEFARALELAPTSPFVRARYAGFLVESGDLGGATAQAQLLAPPTGATTNSAIQNPNDAPESGALLIRLSEAALFRQKLNEALDYASRAVKILPDSALAHYQLGRVFLEQNRTAQAENQFRLATALDPDLARARYALGLTQDFASSGRDTSRPAGQIAAALESGQSGGLNVRNLATPGANDRIQAAIQDPTVVRTATRSFGDFQLDAVLGENGEREGTLSFLRESSNRRAVYGVGVSRVESEGVRANADSQITRFSALYGQKESGSPSGFFLSGEWRRDESGLNFGPESNSANVNSRVNRNVSPDLLGGYVRQWNGRSRTRLLVQSSRAQLNAQVFIGTQQNRLRSENLEIRHDQRVSDSLGWSAGGNIGQRRFDSRDFLPSPDPMAPSITENGLLKARVSDVYVRANWQPRSGLRLSGELKGRRLKRTLNSRVVLTPGPPIPETRAQETSFVGLPLFVASYRLDGQSNLRYRARRHLGSLEDFSFLAPIDIFLFSQREFPELPFFERGRSHELEFDRTLNNASFVRLSVFQFSADQGSNSAGELNNGARFRGARLGYEGTFNRETSFFLNAALNQTRGTVLIGELSSPRQEFTGVPRYQIEVGAQYLSDRGFFVQPSLAYFASRFAPDFLEGARTKDGGFALANLRVGKRSGLKSVVFAEISNLFDKFYTVRNQSGEVLQQRRTARIGVTQRF